MSDQFLRLHLEGFDGFSDMQVGATYSWTGRLPDSSPTFSHWMFWTSLDPEPAFGFIINWALPNIAAPLLSQMSEETVKRKRHQAFARFTCVHFLVILVIRRNAPEEVNFLRPCQFASDKVLRPWRLHDLLNQGHAQQFRRKRQRPLPNFALICACIYAAKPLILNHFFRTSAI